MVSARAVTLGARAAALRRRIGPTAWCALEILVASSIDGHGREGLRAEASVRSVAAELGVSKNTAHRALSVLCASRLAVGTQRRSPHGHFEIGTYDLAIPEQIIELAAGHPCPCDRPVRAPSAVASSAALSSRTAQMVEQLVLLPPE